MTLPKHMLTLIDTVAETVQQSLKSFAESKLSHNPEMLSPELFEEVAGALNESLNTAGRMGLKRFLEQYDCPDTEIHRDGRSYRLKDSASTKAFLTIFGEVELQRRYYHCRDGGPGIVPLDEAWQMHNRYATPEVVEKLLWGSSVLVPTELEKFCARLGRFEPSASCIQDIIRRDGARMAATLESEEGIVASRQIDVPEETEIVVASMDGANVLLREKGVRRGRPAQRPGVGGMKWSCQEEAKRSASSYKNAMVGSFSFYRTLEGVVDIESGSERVIPERLNSIYCARMPEERAISFKKEFEALAGDIGRKVAEKEVIKILLLDGARGLWNYVEGNESFEGYHLLLDFYHATEHLSNLAEALFGKQSEKSRKWYEKWRCKLKHEERAVERLLRSMNRYRSTLRIPSARLEDIRTEEVFFRRNRTRMNYHDHLINGWPIGSGPVEAACKTIVKQRMCQSGMRWSREGGRPILALRVLYKSDQWAQAWAYHMRHHWQDAA